MARLIIIAIIALLNTACFTPQTTVNPGKLQIGFEPTWATNKQPPSCSVSQTQSWSNKTSTVSESWSCSQVYDLGDMRCVRNWTEYRSAYNAPGKHNDSSTFSQYNAQPSCRPLTTAELVERAERRRQAQAAEAARTTKK